MQKEKQRSFKKPEHTFSIPRCLYTRESSLNYSCVIRCKFSIFLNFSEQLKNNSPHVPGQIKPGQ